jgi:hypothetical protein
MNKSINGIERSIERSYDSMNRITQEIYPDADANPANNEVTYEHDEGGYLTSVGYLDGETTIPYVSKIRYTPLGKVDWMVYGNNAVTSFD